MLDSRSYCLLAGLVVLVWFTRPAHGFGAGNIGSISKIEGQNWRHGDIEDALLALTMARVLSGKKFNPLQVSRVYFGNWLRDYSQAIDVGTVKSVSAEAIRLLLSVLAFLTFGYGSGEFEVTASRLGCYRPEDHIDNPKNYADNVDARQYDNRLRGPVDERVELGIDPHTGLKNYIANERAGIVTSARHVRGLFGGAVELARRYGRDNNKADKYEALRLMGTGLHCLEDYFAHSNYTELALMEMGEHDVFPHVGRNTKLQIQGSRHEVYPIVTGTFGGVDFLHSVTGELSDKLAQNELDELEGALKESQTADTSILRTLLDMIPDGIFGGKHQSDKIDEIQSNAQGSDLKHAQVSPLEPEEYTRYVQQVFGQVMPAIQFHDDVMKAIERAIGSIPVLPKIVSQLEEQLSVFVFSIIAPFIVPVIHQVRNELRTGSSEIIESSEREQHIVFEDDRCSDPTHSMLSKDHFTNILNECAGRCAAKMIHWAVPQLMEAMDNDSIDVERLMDRIVHGIMAHPAQRHMGDDGASEGRQLMFSQVEEWWRDMDEPRRQDYRNRLSRQGVQNGENHREGVHDTGHGHGCAGKLKMRKTYGAPSGLEDQLAGAAATAILGGASGLISNLVQSETGIKMPEYGRPFQPDEGLGGLMGAAESLLGGAFEGGRGQTETRSSSHHGADGSYTQVQTEYGQSGDRYGQAQRTETRYPDGGSQTEYRRSEQGDGGGGYSYQQQQTQTSQTYDGGYQQQTETRQSYDGGYQQQQTHVQQSYSSSGGGGEEYGEGRERRHHGHHGQHRVEYDGAEQDQGGYGGGGGFPGARQEGAEGGYGERRDEGEGGGGGRHHHGHHRRDDNDGEDDGGDGEGLGGLGNILGQVMREAFK